MSRPIRFIVTYYSSGGISIDSEVITDPVLTMVHTQNGCNQMDNIDNDYVLVRSRKRLTECGYLGTFSSTEDKNKPGYKVTLEIDGTEYDYAYVHDHYAEVQMLLENDRMEKLLEEMDD